MLAPHLKSKVDDLWNKFWSAGITNPLVAIEQITYLLFLKRLEGLDAERVKQGKPSIYSSRFYPDGEQCRWSFIIQEPEDINHLNDVVFPWLRELESIIAKIEQEEKNKGNNGKTGAEEVATVGNRMSDAYFQLDPNKGAILSGAITLIDGLFNHVDASSVDDDLMGDIFEYLLSEISSSGKNGQFRTPRHIIRVLVELLDPKVGERVIDPAAGTGGFLFSAMSHVMMRNTSPEMLELEWDGTAHQAYGDQLTPEQDALVHQGNYYVGLDNDRTMVRIGWMNMILHGIQTPQIHQRDSLGKLKDDDGLRDVLASESFQYVLANPPFTGTVDRGTLDLSMFPKAAEKGKKATVALTDKSELLFIWRMLDFLAVGGRCAVIIPEGVLFGSTEAHTRLRRELLTEHTVEAIISLPGGAFQPYTGVKTSIIVFQKDTPKSDSGSWTTTDEPRTQRVWFYEVQEEAYSLDAKRAERKGLNNDLWDMLEKFKTRGDVEGESLDYYQPNYYTERWRLVDENTVSVFAGNKAIADAKGKVTAIHELFPELPSDPIESVRIVDESTKLKVRDVLLRTMELSEESYMVKSDGSAIGLFKALLGVPTYERRQRLFLSTKLFEKIVRSIVQNKEQSIFDRDGSIGLALFKKSCKEIQDCLLKKSVNAEEWKTQQLGQFDEAAARLKIEAIAREYAKLDGYDVTIRTTEVFKQENVLTESKSWWADVRTYAKNDDWESEDGTLKGSHDENGNIRPAYLKSIKLYDENGKLNTEYLDPDCIEAKGWNLSAGQYKPFTFTTIESEQSVADMIRDLQNQEQKILEGLANLLKKVEMSA